MPITFHSAALNLEIRTRGFANQLNLLSSDLDRATEAASRAKTMMATR